MHQTPRPLINKLSLETRSLLLLRLIQMCRHCLVSTCYTVVVFISVTSSSSLAGPDGAGFPHFDSKTSNNQPTKSKSNLHKKRSQPLAALPAAFLPQISQPRP